MITETMTDVSHLLTDRLMQEEPDLHSLREEDLLRTLRRECVLKPVIFIGSGTCGLGAGADKTLHAVNHYLEEKNIDADIVQVGCIGMCSAEPLLDVQLPGKNRICFQKVTGEKVAILLDSVLNGEPGENPAGNGTTCPTWMNIRSSPGRPGSY